MLTSFLENPMETLRGILLLLPGLILALCLHESAHGYVAEKCGDPTARMMGRITLNPAKHFDPLGFLCMLIIGFGWAKPVPVNPRNFRNYRRDDLKVSLAGITANLCLFLVCFIILSLLFTAALGKLPCCVTQRELQDAISNGDTFRYVYNGECRLVTPEGYVYAEETLFRYITGFADIVIKPAFGGIVSLIYEMVANCMVLNLSLAVFNLIPLPPLDGYHVLNDLVLHKDLFAQAKTRRIAGGILTALILIGFWNPRFDVLSIAINWVRSGVMGYFTELTRLFARLVGVI